MKKVRSFLLLGCALAIGLVVVASASAGGKASFTPKPGEYRGTMTTSTGTFPDSARVLKSGGKYTVEVALGNKATCSDGSSPLTPVGIPATTTVKGKAFSENNTVEISNYGSKFTTKVSGHFTSETAFSGTASASAPEVPGAIPVPSCTTGTIHFSLKHK